MPLLPRFKYSLGICEVFKDFFSLCFSNMRNKDSIPKFEKELANYFQHDHANTFSSYRMGVYYYLKYLDLPKGSEILLTPITIPDLVNIILILGLKPKFIDLDPDSHTLSLKELKNEASEKTRCLIITYLSGIVINGVEIKKFCQDKKINIIEDISQAYSSLSIDKTLPFFGDVKIGSLSSGKLISTYTGGFALSNDISLRNFFKDSTKDNIPPPKSRLFNEIFKNMKILLATSKFIFPLTYLYLWILWNFSPDKLERLTKSKFYTRVKSNDIFFDDYPVLREEIPSGWFTNLCSWQANIGLRFLKKLDIKSDVRKNLAKLFISKLNSNAISLIPQNALNPNCNIYHFPIKLTQNRNYALKKLFQHGIDSEGYGLNLCNTEKIFSSYSRELTDAKQIKYNHIFLPIHESYSPKHMVYLAKTINHLSNTEVLV